MVMNEIFWHSRKVYDYTFDFMAMSCLLLLTVLWHLSKAIRLFLVACVHYNYKWVTNSLVDFQILFNEIMFESCIEVVDLGVGAMIPNPTTIFKYFLGFVTLVVIPSSLH